MSKFWKGGEYCMKKNYISPQILIHTDGVRTVVEKSGMGNCKHTYTFKRK